MKLQTTTTVTQRQITRTPSRVLPPMDDELHFNFSFDADDDFDVHIEVQEPETAPSSEPEDVKAAIIRWLEELA